MGLHETYWIRGRRKRLHTNVMKVMEKKDKKVPLYTSEGKQKKTPKINYIYTKWNLYCLAILMTFPFKILYLFLLFWDCTSDYCAKEAIL